MSTPSCIVISSTHSDYIVFFLPPSPFLDGRRPIYLASIPFLAIGSLGVASSNSVTQLMVSRIVQAAGASAGMSVGSGVIGDIYRLEERGFVMGIYFAVCCLSKYQPKD